MKMSKLIVLYTIVSFLSGCQHPRINEPLFIPEAFQDTLENYIDAVSNVKSDCNLPINMTILCMGGADTTILMTVGVAPCCWDGLCFKGGCEINGINCLVNYVNIESMSAIINESALSFKKERYESYFDMDRLSKYAFDFEIDKVTSRRKYKLHGIDSLQMISKYERLRQTTYNNL